MLILDVVAERAAARGDHPFILHADRRVSYREFDRLTNQAANALIDLGIRKGDRVTVAMSNSVEYLVAAFGVLKAGAIYNPVNPALGSQELGYIINHAGPAAIITEPGSAKNIIAPELQRPVGCRLAAFGEVAGALRFDELVDCSAEIHPPVSIGANDASTLLYTSGTTGNPKGVLFHHRSTGAAGEHFLTALGITQDDTIVTVTPLFHGNAWGATVTALQAGGTIAFPAAFHASEFWPLVHASGATVVYTLGTVLAMLLTRERSELERTHKLRVILGLGSAPIREQILTRFGVRYVAECFGSTDAGVVTIEPLGAAPRAGSAGPPVPGVEIHILDDEGHVLKARETGEIVIRSPHCMAAYFRDPEQTAQALRDGWFYTGDLGYLDEEGWLYFVDRKRDVIRRGGENISSVLIEKTLREHPKVVEAAVIGVPDPVLGQEVKAFIVAKEPVAADELRVFAAERLAKFQVPRLWEFRDALPKTPSQRVEKYKLRQESGGSDKPLLG
ncbi:MAG TPA: AMP-binding protein [Candidatus Binatia bacterium]|nr:AMP-binding protein [Candidatus Binatia bacterium]